MPLLFTDDLTTWPICYDTLIKKVKKQQYGMLTCVDSDEPVQPPFKLRNSKCCLASSLTVIEYSSN